ncbi:CZB domain-containing protein [Crenobacter luteus]
MAETMARVIGQGANVSFLEIVKLDHIVFKLEIYKALIGFSALDADSLSSHTTCRLGKWYYEGRGYHECRDHPDYLGLEKPHAAVHEQGRQALSAWARQDAAATREALREMERQSEAVMAILTRFEQQPCTKTLAG